MKYMLLIYGAEDAAPAPGAPEFGAFMQGYDDLYQELTNDGVWIAGEGLQDAETASTVTVRGGKTIARDGPFAETKETMGGFYLIDCDNLDQAIAYAAKIPSATYGSVEIRPVMDYEQ
ncbi:MAG: YciI family protein [Robiginitomaculum sp.]|nr:YciI family protein [Robiginitomaculum sp.]